MAKTHTKINQLAGETLKGFAYANNTNLELVDDVQAVRDLVTHHTEIIRDYDTTATNLAFTGSGANNLSIDAINVQTPTTITIDSQDVFSGIFFGGVGLNDVSVNYATYSGNRPVSFTFGIDAANDETSTGSGGFTGTPINGEIFNDGLGNSFKFISYDSGTDTIYAYSIIGNVVGTYTGANSGSTVTLVNTFTAGPNEVGAWSDSLGNNGVWSIQPTVAYTIGVPTNTLDVTFAGAGHNVTDFWGVLFAKGSIVYDVQSQSGALTVGETLNGSLGSTAVFGYQFSSGQVALTQITGSPALGNGSETFTGSISGQTINLANPITYTDTYSATDGMTTTQFNIVQSENTVNIFSNTFNWGSEIGHTTGDFWALTFPLVNIETGYETQGIVLPNVPVPLEGSVLFGENTDGKAFNGVIDLTPFGWESSIPTFGKIYTDGSQSTMFARKGETEIQIFDVTGNRSSILKLDGNNTNLEASNNVNTIRLSMNNNTEEFSVFGFGTTTNFKLNINNNHLSYRLNNQEQFFPNSFGLNGQYMRTDAVGNMYWGNADMVQPSNGLMFVGQDYGLGGILSQYTNIDTNLKGINIGGLDGSGNTSGLIAAPQAFNGVVGFHGAYSDANGYNKSGIYTGVLDEHYAVSGFRDNNGTIQRAAYTLHRQDLGTSTSEKRTVLRHSDTPNTTYTSDTVSNSTNVTRKDVYRHIPSSQKIEENYDAALGTFEREITDTIDTNTYTQNKTDFSYSSYPNTRDDSATTNPTNFIYTDATGEFKSAPLGKGTYSLPAYADDAAAGLGGVVAGELYQTDGTGAAPLTVAGIVMIKQ